MTASTPIRGTPRRIVFGLAGLLGGWVIAWQWNPLPLSPRDYPVPLPYCLPKIPDGTSLRMAMVHDVLHERYLRHGAAWYTKRNAESRKFIEQHQPSSRLAASVEYLDTLDDLAVGLQRTGHNAEALGALQQKAGFVDASAPVPATQESVEPRATLQPEEIDLRDLTNITAAQSLSPIQHHRYSLYANLGTVQILDALPKLLSGNADPAIRAEIHESLGNIERAVAINPGGHFGREVWQAILTEHLLAAMDHPELLTKYDMIGEPLGDPPEALQAWEYFLYRRPDWRDRMISPTERLRVRQRIVRVGIEPTWAAVVKPDYPCPMPFDEPAMAIVGMWTVGGGPNPHFALALGRIMENVGQSSIAWNAYERTIELAEGFWPDPEIRRALVTLCRQRQSDIARRENTTNPASWETKMRAQHIAELAWGLSYQKSYQDFESSQIAAGVPLNDPDFYAAFFHDRPPIASDPGTCDTAVVTQREAASFGDVLPCMVLGLGVGLLWGRIFPGK